MDYVEERAKLYELNKVVKMWQRKVEIAEVIIITRGSEPPILNNDRKGTIVEKRCLRLSIFLKSTSLL